jgi:hypothetical protein
MRGLHLKYGKTPYQCALVHWYSRVGDEPDEETEMWIVEPPSIIHLDCIPRAAHLIAVCREPFVGRLASLPRVRMGPAFAL